MGKEKEIDVAVSEEEEFDNVFDEGVESRVEEQEVEQQAGEESEGVAQGQEQQEQVEAQVGNDEIEDNVQADVQTEVKDAPGEDNAQVETASDISVDDILAQIEDLAQEQRQVEAQKEEKGPSLDAIQDGEVKEQIKTFLEFYPEYEQTVLTLATGNDDISKKFIQKLKGDADVETVLALATKYEMDQLKNQVQQVFEENTKLKSFLQQRYEEEARLIAQNHIATIVSKHPEMGEILQDQGKLESFRNKVLSWAEEKPFKEYKEIKRVLDAGTAQEVVSLLDRYKQEIGASVQQAKPKQEEIQASMAVKAGAKTSYIPTSTPPKDDFEATWETITKH